MRAKQALVIDDDSVVLDSVQRILEAEGWTSDRASHGRQGLEMALKRPYDVVLSDIRMPDVGGMKVLREIKRRRPGQPVVMITGYATVASAVQALKLGADDYLEKPFTPDQLMGSIFQALQNAEARDITKEEQIHREEVLAVLERAAEDATFVRDLVYRGADALDAYELTATEKLAILTGDVEWIESHLGKLTPTQAKWLEQRLAAEVW